MGVMIYFYYGYFYRYPKWSEIIDALLEFPYFLRYQKQRRAGFFLRRGAKSKVQSGRTGKPLIFSHIFWKNAYESSMFLPYFERKYFAVMYL